MARKYIFLSLVVSLCFGLCGKEGETSLLIDCDAGADDFIGILYLLYSKQVDIKVITLTPTGKSHYEYGAKNISRLLHLAKAESIPVASTRQPSISHVGEYPFEIRKRVDEFFDHLLPAYPVELYKKSSSDALVEFLLNSDEKVTLFCTGPLTNLAIALHMEPAILTKIERVYVLGGAVNVNGNIIEKMDGQLNHLAEYNIFLDAKAADIVFRSGLPITLIPLDALKNLTTISAEIYRHLVKTQRSVISDFIFKSCQPFYYPQKAGEANFWGPLGAALMLNPDFGQSIRLNLTVQLDRGPIYGSLCLDLEHGSPVDVYIRTDCMKFFNHFIKTISKIK